MHRSAHRHGVTLSTGSYVHVEQLPKYAASRRQHYEWHHHRWWLRRRRSVREAEASADLARLAAAPADSAGAGSAVNLVGGGGGSGSSGWAITLPNPEAMEKQLHEADESAKKADDLAKRYTDLLKQHEAVANASDESGQMYKQFRELVEEQRRMAEDQRRTAEDRTPPGGSGATKCRSWWKTKLGSNCSARLASNQIPIRSNDARSCTRLKKLIDDLKKEGKFDEASEAAQLLTGIQERVSELGKLSSLVDQASGRQKAGGQIRSANQGASRRLSKIGHDRETQ